jgi:hypothetical protein
MIMAVDTNRYRDFCEAVPEVVAHFQLAERICLPFPVLAERWRARMRPSLRNF